MTINYCKGCLVTLMCPLRFYNDKGQCPCCICIIKMMCEDDCVGKLDIFKATVNRMKGVYYNNETHYNCVRYLCMSPHMQE